jgi:putative membrane protein
MLLNKQIPASYIFRKVRKDLALVTLVVAAVQFVTTQYAQLLPDLPLAVPAFMGTAISILLSFKLSQSYERWWEARKVWGSIVNDSRSLVIQLMSLVQKGNEHAIRSIALRQIAWCYSLGQALRGLSPSDNLSPFIGKEETETLAMHANKPLALLHRHGQDIARLRERQQLDIIGHVQLDNTLVRLCDAQGRAERIKTTVFPATYRLFLHFNIYLFLIMLSLSLKDSSPYFEFPLLIFISSAFFLLEKSATHMQDPFENRPTDTAVTAIARTIEINIKQLIGEDSVPEPQKPDGFYLN